MWPRISVTSNQSRFRTVSDAFAIAPVTASSTLEVEEPVISIVLYTLSLTAKPPSLGVDIRAAGGSLPVGDHAKKSEGRPRAAAPRERPSASPSRTPPRRL